MHFLNKKLFVSPSTLHLHLQTKPCISTFSIIKLAFSLFVTQQYGLSIPVQSIIIATSGLMKTICGAVLCNVVCGPRQLTVQRTVQLGAGLYCVVVTGLHSTTPFIYICHIKLLPPSPQLWLGTLYHVNSYLVRYTLHVDVTFREKKFLSTLYQQEINERKVYVLVD